MMEDFQSETDSDYTSYWRDWFISSRGNEYFCEIDEEYITDRFNLTGLNTEVHYYAHALDLITDVFDLDCEDDMRDAIEKSARHLYGLVHARYIVTTRGLAKMVEKYKKGDFGRCPRVLCEGGALLPVGLNDNPGVKTVKLYCARCEDIYNPKSSRHATIDGAYFGSSFHNILFQVYPALVPPKSRRRYEPRVFGFRMHGAASLARWQDSERRDLRQRLTEVFGDKTAASTTTAAAATATTTAAANTASATTAPTTGGAEKDRLQLFLEDAESSDGVGEDEEAGAGARMQIEAIPQ